MSDRTDSANSNGKPAGPASGKKISALKAAQSYKLHLWLDNQRDMIRNTRLTLEEVTEAANKAMKPNEFTVTEHNVRYALEAVGVELNPRPNAPGRGPLAVVLDKCSNLEAANARLEERVTKLEADLIDALEALKSNRSVILPIVSRLKWLENEFGIKEPLPAALTAVR